jgi:hypothetical protein
MDAHRHAREAETGMEHEGLEHGELQRDELNKLDKLDARGGHLDDAVTEPDLSAISPTDDTVSLGRTSAASDHWTPSPGGWLAPLSIDAALPDALSDAPHDALYDATSDVAPMSWPASPGWPPSPTLVNQPTRRMRRRRADVDRPLFFALGALLGAVLVSGAALLAIVYIASHPGLFTLASQRPSVVAPTATVRATATATRTPTPSPTIRPVGANPAPIIVPQPKPTAHPTPRATATPRPAPTSSPTAQPTATATPAATASPTPTAEPDPSTTPTATPAPTPTPSPAPAATAATATPTATSP